jgi:hypothetical protein
MSVGGSANVGFLWGSGVEEASEYTGGFLTGGGGGGALVGSYLEYSTNHGIPGYERNPVDATEVGLSVGGKLGAAVYGHVQGYMLLGCLEVPKYRVE